MTTWLPSALALLLFAVEACRVLREHFDRREWEQLVAGSLIVTVGVPQVFRFSPGCVVDAGLTADAAERRVVVKINYRDGRLWLADVCPYRRIA